MKSSTPLPIALGRFKQISQRTNEVRQGGFEKIPAFGRTISVVLVASPFIPLMIDDGTRPNRWVSVGGVRPP